MYTLSGLQTVPEFGRLSSFLSIPPTKNPRNNRSVRAVLGRSGANPLWVKELEENDCFERHLR